jgi:hypothetical protein
MRARGLWCLLTVVALAAGGCSGSDSGSPGTTAAATTTGTTNRTIEMQTEDGQASLSLDGKLPPGWPTAFPLPPGATPAGSGSLVKDSTGAMVGVFKLSGSPTDAFAFYTDNQSLQVTDKSSLGGGDTFIGRAKFSGTYDGSVTVGGAAGRDLLVVVLRPSSAGTTAPAGSAPATSAPAGTTGSTTA